MKEKFICYCESPIGMLCIEADEEAVTGIYLNVKEKSGDCRENTVTERARQELAEYFARERKQFTVPVRMEGTAFQKAVWTALQEIPYGETRSYGEIARAIGNPKASRAVGNANNKNRIPILIPCHRVIGADGSLVGFGGGLPIKETLLALEGRQSISSRRRGRPS